MPAHAKNEPLIKGPLGSAKFCASVKNYVQLTLDSYHFAGELAVKNFRGMNKDPKKPLVFGKYFESQKTYWQSLAGTSTIYNTWIVTGKR